MPRSKKTPGEPSGDLPLQFLTGSHPDEFKESSSRQKVRSQVMKDFRRRQTRSPLPGGSPSQSTHLPGTGRPRSTFAARSLLNVPTPPLSPASQDFLASFTPCDHLAESQIQLGLAASSQSNNLPCYVHPSIRDKGFCFACLAWLTNTDEPPTSPQRNKDNHLALLSSVCSEFARRDLLLHTSGKSRASLSVESNVMQILNDNLAMSDGASDHETILAIAYLIISETMQGNSTVLDVHINGFEAIARRHGGLGSLVQASDIAIVTTAQTLVTKLLFEKEAPLMYSSDIGSAFFFSWSSGAVADSPIYKATTPQRDASQSSDTSIILHDMQALTTQLLLDSNTGTNFSQTEEKAANVLRGLVPLASTAGAGLQDQDRSVFEAVRLSALIYATALLHGKFFSDAIVIVADRFDKPTLLQDLCDAIYNTNLQQLWGDMAQSLLWVSLVGGAAAGSEGLSIVPSEQSKLRRWLFFPAIACLNLFGTPHATAFMSSLQTMLRVHSALRMERGG